MRRTPGASERELVAEAARRLGEAGLAPGTAGNVSLRVEDLIAVTATGAVMARVTAEDVVVHAHPPVATALACVLDELPAIHYQMVKLGGPVRVARYATFGTTELAQRTLHALEGRFAALMANHGTLTVGVDLEQALERTELLEWASALYWRASALGPPRTLDAGRLDDVRARMGMRRLRPPAEAPA